MDTILLLIKNLLTVQIEKKDQSMRHLLIGLVCLPMWFSTSVSGNELAAIAKNGRYLVVDLTTFNVTDVGDLRRFGLFTIDSAIAGSSVGEAVLEADITSKQLDKNGLAARHVRVKLDRLGINQFSLPPTSVISFTPGNMRWVDGDKQKRISFVGSAKGDPLVFYSNALKKISKRTEQSISVGLPGIGYGVSCADVNDKVVIGTWHHRVVNLSGEKQLEKLDGIAGDNHDFHLTDITDRCHVLMSSKPETDAVQIVLRRVIDIEKNKAMGTFESHRSANFALYNNGTLLLEQKLKSTVVGDGPGVRTTATGVFRVIDSQTGSDVKQFEINGLSSNVIKVVETNSQYLAVLASEYKLQILNLQSYKIIKTIKIPFKRFLVI